MTTCTACDKPAYGTLVHGKPWCMIHHRMALADKEEGDRRVAEALAVIQEWAKEHEATRCPTCKGTGRC